MQFAHRLREPPHLPQKLVRALMERVKSTKPAATEPTATTMRLWPVLKSAEIEKMCRGGKSSPVSKWSPALQMLVLAVH